MKRILNSTILCVILILLATQGSLFGGISLRCGALLPQSDFADFAERGYSIGVAADLQPFASKFLSVVVIVDLSQLGEKEATFIHTDEQNVTTTITQHSKVSFIGGGIGLRIQPPSMIIKPFGEIIGRVASIEQDFKSSSSSVESDITTETKIGYQLNAGILYSIAPTLSLELGGTYVSFFNADFFDKTAKTEINTQSFGIFAGVNFGIGL